MDTMQRITYDKLQIFRECKPKIGQHPIKRILRIIDAARKIDQRIKSTCIRNSKEIYISVNGHLSGKTGTWYSRCEQVRFVVDILPILQLGYRLEE